MSRISAGALPTHGHLARRRGREEAASSTPVSEPFLDGLGGWVSIVVLSWRSPEEAVEAIASVLRAVRGVETEIVLVENGPAGRVDDDVLAALDAKNLRRMTLRRNVGVSKGRNIGIAGSSGQVVVVLDDDARLDTDLVSALQWFHRVPEVALVGPKLVGIDGELAFSCRRFPTVLDKVARRIRFPRWKQVLAKSELWDWDHDATRCVDYVIGACQVIRRDAFDAVGGYDEGMFYGPEDVDLCLRLWEAGWYVVYEPEARVVHGERRITGRPSALTLRHVVSLLRFFRKHRYMWGRVRLYARLGRSGSAWHAGQYREPPLGDVRPVHRT